MDGMMRYRAYPKKPIKIGNERVEICEMLTVVGWERTSSRYTTYICDTTKNPIAKGTKLEVPRERLAIKDSDIHLMLHWGRQDINGKDIYTGDICHDSYFEESGPYEAVFKDDAFYFVDFGGDHLMFDDLTGIVVVGNVYENPEMLPKWE